MTKEKKIFFIPAIQVYNSGDLLINISGVNILRKYGQVIIDDSKVPDWFINNLINDDKDRKLTEITGSSVRRFILSELVKRIFTRKKVEYFLFFQPGHTSRKGKKSGIIYFKEALKNHLLNILGCNICRVGFGIGPFDKLNGMVESFNSYAFKHYAVRDQISLQLAKKLAFKRPGYFPDWGWAYNPNIRLESVPEKSYVIISLRSNGYGKIHNSDYLRPLIQAVTQILKTIGFKGKIIVAYQVKYDYEPSLEILDALIKEFDVEMINHQLDLDEAASLYANAEFIISNRLHVLLLAMLAGTLGLPLITNNDNKKITGIYTDNALGGIILDSGNDPDMNARIVEHSVENRSTIMNLFTERLLINKELIGESMDTLFKK